MAYPIYTHSELRDIVDTKIAKMKNDVDSKYSDSSLQPGYAYATGYLQSLVVGMLGDLPKAKQEFYLNQLKGL